MRNSIQMRNLFFVLVPFLMILAGCDQQKSSGKSGANPPPPPKAPAFVGYYEGEGGSVEQPGPLYALTLMANGGAELVTDSLNFKPEVVELGEWEEIDETHLKVEMDNIRTGSRRALNFERIGTDLIWTGAGNDLAFRKADNVSGRIRELIMWVDLAKVECGNGGKKCLRVSYDHTSQPQTWEVFYEPIQGFNWREGTLYKIRVKETYKGASEADASSVTYELVEVLLEAAG